jgi:hypothetical protein
MATYKDLVLAYARDHPEAPVDEVGIAAAKRSPLYGRSRPGTTGPGPRMLAVARYVRDHPGCSKAEAGRGGGVNGGGGYAGSVERLIRRGLVSAEGRSRYQLFITDAGRKFAGEEPAP